LLERRPAAAADEPFLRELYATTRPEVAGWEDDAREAFLDIQFRAQQREWTARYPDSTHELIVVDGRPVGRLWVAWLPNECIFVDMTLVPEQRRTGIGTQLMREVISAADARNVPVQLTVERTNAPSLAFCERLGFAVVAEDPVYVVLERPVSPDRPRRASG
jgi:GNAT superfamily N-acetyltransferase